MMSFELARALPTLLQLTTYAVKMVRPLNGILSISLSLPYIAIDVEPKIRPKQLGI